MIKRMTLALSALAMLLAGAGIFTNSAQAQEIIAPPQAVHEAESPLAPFFFADRSGNWQGNGRFWFRGDYMFSWIRGVNTPPLVTTAPVGTARDVAGVTNANDTQILFGNDWLAEGTRPGFRLQAGWWFGGDSPFGLEAGFLWVGSKASTFNGNSDQFPILARPFIDIVANTQEAVLVAFPGSSTGSIDASVRTDSFYSANFAVTEKAFDVPGFRMTGLAGYRYYRYSDALNVSQVLNVTDPNFIPGTQVVTSDSFTARNDFHAFDMGFRAEYFWDRLSLEVLTKLAVGDVRREVTIRGQQSTLVPGAPAVVDPAGVLALSTNSGTFVSHDWKVMPEVGVTLGWQVSPNLNLRVGYSFILLNGVARAVDQVDTSINPNFFPPAIGGGPNRPAFGWVRQDLWIQSINLGVLWTY